jgi:putative two-component system response regulator
MRAGHVLVVDDEAFMRRFMRTVLEPLGFEVREAANGAEALAMIDQEAPEAILLDILMPGLDGYEVTRHLKENPRTRFIPIIVVTTLDTVPDKIKGIESGVDDFLAKPVNVLELRARVRSLVKLKRYMDELEHASIVMKSVALTVEQRDTCTGGHCRRLSFYGAAVGERLGLDDEAIALLKMGGILHDLGKIAVSDTILNKPARLAEDEFDVIRRHPLVGDDLVRPMHSLDKVRPLIRHHHEKLDGSGYPDGLTGNDIPIEVRVLTAVDVFDALASQRPYKKPFPIPTCFDILHDGVSRGWWDGDVVDTLEAVVRDR